MTALGECKATKHNQEERLHSQSVRRTREIILKAVCPPKKQSKGLLLGK